jgi:hypothetical protein
MLVITSLCPSSTFCSFSQPSSGGQLFGLVAVLGTGNGITFEGLEVSPEAATAPAVAAAELATAAAELPDEPVPAMIPASAHTAAFIGFAHAAID